MHRTKKKIALFSPQLSPVGTEGAMLGIATGLTEQSFQVDLLAAGTEWRTRNSANASIQFKSLLPVGFVSLLPARGFSYRISLLVLALFLIPLLAIYLRRNRPDYLVVGLLPWAATAAVQLSLTRTLLVISVQGLPRPSRTRRFLWRWMARRSAAWVTPAESISRRVQDMSRALTPISEIPNPVLNPRHLSAHFDVPDHPWFKNAGKHVVLGAGRLTRQKNFQHLLRSFAKVSEDDSICMVIVGEGEDRSALEELARNLGISDSVSMPGHVPNPMDYMAHAAVFVLSSRWEGPGHVLIEALATGSPCITVDCPSGPAEILGNGKFGAVVPMEDPAALAGVIRQALDHPDSARQKSLAARQELVQYTPSYVGKMYAELLLGINKGGAQ